MTNQINNQNVNDKLKDFKIKKYVLYELKKFQFNTDTKGFKYLVEAIVLSIKEPDILENLNKNLYPKIACKYNQKGYLNIKWSIEKSISYMYTNTNSTVLCKYFNFVEDKKPGAKLVISTVVNNLEKIQLYIIR